MSFKSPLKIDVAEKKRNSAYRYKLFSLDNSQLYPRFSGVLKVLFVLYVLVSIIYTLVHLYLLINTNYDSLLSTDVVFSSKGQGITSLLNHSLQTLFPEEPVPLLHASPSLIYSKLFQTSLQPFELLPYYLKMTYEPKHDDITITTIITIERLSILNNLVKKYQGPISVALHISDDDKKEENLALLHRTHQTNHLMAKYVDLHLLVDKFDRQFNMWRNVARFFARSGFILAMDVDFMLCTDIRANMRALDPTTWSRLANGSLVLVVPAFEFSKTSVELNSEQYPSEKKDVVGLVKQHDLSMFHNKWRRGHGPTNYSHWYRATEAYKVSEFNYNYEPYVLMKQDGLPWCDERFVGYGSNKAACLFEIYLAGVEFWVLPNDFLIHQRHPYPENDRRMERKYNKRLYDAYREEVCHRYGRMFKGVEEVSLIDERICGSTFSNFYGI